MLITSGLHKEPSKFAQLSAVDVCVRRQLWWSLVTLDVQLAYSSGLPPMIDFTNSDVQPITELSEALEPPNKQAVDPRSNLTSTGRSISNVFAAGKFDFYRQSRDLLSKLYSDSLFDTDLDGLIEITRSIRENLESRKAQIATLSTGNLQNSIFTDREGSQDSPMPEVDKFARFADTVLSMLAAKPFSVMFGPLRRQGLLHRLAERVPK